MPLYLTNKMGNKRMIVEVTCEFCDEMIALDDEKFYIHALGNEGNTLFSHSSCRKDSESN